MENVANPIPAVQGTDSVLIASIAVVRTLDTMYKTKNADIDLLAMKEALSADQFRAYVSASRLIRQVKKALA